MPFMDLYTQHGSWYVVDGNVGGAVIPADLVSFTIGSGHVFERGTDGAFAPMEKGLLEYYEGNRLDTIELQRGWCARYSANGYLDCTDWCGPYATEDEALRACREMYGDDEDEEDDEDEDYDQNDEFGDGDPDKELFDGQETEVQS